MAPNKKIEYRRTRKAYRPEQKTVAQDPFFARYRFVLAMIAVGFVMVLATVSYRQIIQSDFLRSEGDHRYLRDGEIAARRGIISDRNGEPLAVSSPVETVWADPSILVSAMDRIPQVAKVLKLDPTSLQEKVRSAASKQKRFMYIKRRISFDEAEALHKLKASVSLPGLAFTTEYKRFYPGSEIFSHIVGFTDINDKGQEGIELKYDSLLKGNPGLHRMIRDGRGRMVQDVEQIRAPNQGKDIVLSLDSRLQYLAYRELERGVKEHRAIGGSLVILDPRTGEILAMVNQPAYNPNNLHGKGAEYRRNRAATDVFEPGSTAKPFSVALALSKGKVSPNTIINTNPGVMQLGPNKIRDVHNYGVLTVSDVIKKSSNIGIYKIARMMSYADMWQLYRSVGFGQRTSVGFPGESSGVLRDYKSWQPFDFAVQSFGYAFSVTPIQLAQAYGVLASNGIFRPATLLKRDVNTFIPSAGEEKRVLAAKSVAATRFMMERVVEEKGGTGASARVEGYRVAGKTGTAKKSFGRRGYLPNKYQLTFAGFAPAEDPRLVIVVMIDEPDVRYGRYAAQVAAPVFQRVMAGALRLMNIPPSTTKNQLLVSQQRDTQE